LVTVIASPSLTLFPRRDPVRIRTTLTLVAAALLPAAGLSTQDRGNEPQEDLSGVWKVVWVETGGKVLPEEETRSLRYIITADRFIRTNDDKVESEAGYKLDSSKSPRWLNVFDPTGKQNTHVPMIYALEGDRLKLCFRVDFKANMQSNKPLVRPTRFNGEKGSMQVLIVLQRAKD
jgi:uncharacterized protein (TIGR03067 family)